MNLWKVIVVFCSGLLLQACGAGGSDDDDVEVDDIDLISASINGFSQDSTGRTIISSTEHNGEFTVSWRVDGGLYHIDMLLSRDENYSDSLDINLMSRNCNISITSCSQTGTESCHYDVTKGIKCGTESYETYHNITAVLNENPERKAYLIFRACGGLYLEDCDTRSIPVVFAATGALHIDGAAGNVSLANIDLTSADFTVDETHSTLKIALLDSTPLSLDNVAVYVDADRNHQLSHGDIKLGFHYVGAERKATPYWASADGNGEWTMDATRKISASVSGNTIAWRIEHSPTRLPNMTIDLPFSVLSAITLNGEHYRDCIATAMCWLAP